MKLTDEIKYRALAADGSINWTSPSGPVGSDWYEVVVGLSPVPSEHPPSLKNPKLTKIPTAQDGWKQGSSAKARKQALSDLVEIHKRLLKQGRPTLSRTAHYPLFPSIATMT